MRINTVLYQEASGAIGNIQAQTGASGVVLQRKTRRAYQGTTRQKQRTAMFAFINSRWQSVTPEVRQMWEDYAVTLEKYNSVGDRIILSGYQAWSASALSLVGSIFQNTPHPNNVRVFSGTGYFDFTVDYAGFVGGRYIFNFSFPEASLLFVYVGEPVRNTLSTYKGNFDVVLARNVRADLLYRYSSNIPAGYYRLIKIFCTQGISRLSRIVEFKLYGE